ncbi:hypothetical protein [Salinibacterium sp. ZJ454]|uniref:hypothetical protein n=1 Tax=Salinibacterium sp. ZJ454 TaxID=2708339 RepID=UPI0014245AB0|nr:hypothetical protein [Salinibacterium sp. ZJ454]
MVYEPNFWNYVMTISWGLLVAFGAAVLASLIVLIIAAIRALNAYSHDKRLRTAMLLAEYKES